MRPWMCLAAVLAVTGCGKKNPPEAGPEAGGANITAEMPDTADARAFAKKLVQTEVTSWSPTDGGVLEYETLTFLTDGRWAAQAEISAGDESVPCKEAGTWKIEEAESASKATMVWTVGQTTCASRDMGTETRVQMGIAPDGTYQIAFR